MACTGECCADFTLNPNGVVRFPAGFLVSLGERHFTCNKWDPITKLCTVYPERPDICREYPDRWVVVCPHCGMETVDANHPDPRSQRSTGVDSPGAGSVAGGAAAVAARERAAGAQGDG